MGGKNVKNTMIERLLQIVAPHPCFGCGKVGSTICLDCKYDIVHDPYVGCFYCQTPTLVGICSKHSGLVERAAIVSMRATTLKAAIDGLKFHNAKATAKDLAEILDLSLPELPEDTILVPVPTLPSHRRQRGFDQVELIARHFSQIRSLTVSYCLERTTTTTQHTSSRKERLAQASVSYKIKDTVSLPTSAIYLLLDDIVTTGATLDGAAKVLSVGGKTVWAAALAYQPLD
jgi:ComF family protein